MFISLSLIITTFVFANAPIEPPGEPGKPKTTNWGRNFCDLAWAKPLHDGGASISSYDTEKRDEYTGKWVSSGVTDNSRPKFKVVDLQEGETYEFRVIANNRAGKSIPSDASAPVITKDR